MRILEIIDKNFRIVSVGDDMSYDDIDDVDQYSIISDAEQIIRENGMNLLRDDNITDVAMIGDVVVGVLYSAVHGNTMNWSIAVKKEHQGKGIATKLYGRLYPEDFVDYLVAELIPPYSLENMVKRLDYVLVGQDGDFRIYKKDLT